jgi:hypothetical protein
VKNINSTLLDEHLQSLVGIQEVGTDAFFYTRLKARMERELLKDNWNFPLKPIWIIGTMAFFLAINIFMFSQRVTTKENNRTSASTIESFAEAYDQKITSY